MSSQAEELGENVNSREEAAKVLTLSNMLMGMNEKLSDHGVVHENARRIEATDSADDQRDQQACSRSESLCSAADCWVHSAVSG